MALPRLRVFAGPNGSGKSRLKDHLPPAYWGHYLNVDDLELQFRQKGFDTTTLPFVFNYLEFQQEIRHSWLTMPHKVIILENLSWRNSMLYMPSHVVNSYFSSFLVGFLRKKLITARLSLSFETVMSSADKLDFLTNAKRAGYRNYLYYIATEDPEINISRVKARVALGGHDVPEEKIRSRYYRSLQNLYTAITLTDRAYIFDNTANNQVQTWIAEVTDGRDVVLRSEYVPAWFVQYVLNA